jgi:hypothetical protein
VEAAVRAESAPVAAVRAESAAVADVPVAAAVAAAAVDARVVAAVADAREAAAGIVSPLSFDFFPKPGSGCIVGRASFSLAARASATIERNGEHLSSQPSGLSGN